MLLRYRESLNYICGMRKFGQLEGSSPGAALLNADHAQLQLLYIIAGNSSNVYYIRSPSATATYVAHTPQERSYAISLGLPVRICTTATAHSHVIGS